MTSSCLVIALLIFHPLLYEAICTGKQPLPDSCQQAATKLKSDPSYLTTHCTSQCANPLLADCKDSNIANLQLTLALCAMQHDRYCYKIYTDAVAELKDHECSHACTDDCYTAAINFVESLGCCLMKYIELNATKDVLTEIDMLSRSVCNEIPDTNVTDIEDDVIPNIEDCDCIKEQYP